jgi:hypothetical protein
VVPAPPLMAHDLHAVASGRRSAAGPDQLKGCKFVTAGVERDHTPILIMHRQPSLKAVLARHPAANFARGEGQESNPDLLPDRQLSCHKTTHPLVS